MKKIFYPILISTVLAFATTSLAQPAHPNNGGSTPSGGNTPVGGGAAPLDGGIGLLLALAATYSFKKVYPFSGTDNK